MMHRTGAVPDPFHPSYVDASAFQMEKEQYIIGRQSAPGEHLNCEEIAPSQHVHVSSEEILPGRDLASLWSGSDAVSMQHVLHRLIRQGMPQVGECTDDPVISPAGVFPRHPHHQGFDFRGDGRAAGILSVFGAIELLGDQCSIPSQDGVGFGGCKQPREVLCVPAASRFQPG